MGNINKDNLEQIKKMHANSVWFMLGVILLGGTILTLILSKGGNMLAGIVAILILIVGILPVMLVSSIKDPKPKEEKKEEKKS